MTIEYQTTPSSCTLVTLKMLLGLSWLSSSSTNWTSPFFHSCVYKLLVRHRDEQTCLCCCGRQNSRLAWPWSTRQLQPLHVIGQKHYTAIKVTVRRWVFPVWHIWHTFCHIEICKCRVGLACFYDKVILVYFTLKSTGFQIRLPSIWLFQTLSAGGYDKKSWLTEILFLILIQNA